MCRYSLAQMFSIMTATSKFVVPNGSCVTTVAFAAHLESCQVDPSVLLHDPTAVTHTPTRHRGYSTAHALRENSYPSYI